MTLGIPDGYNGFKTFRNAMALCRSQNGETGNLPEHSQIAPRNIISLTIPFFDSHRRAYTTQYVPVRDTWSIQVCSAHPTCTDESG